LPDANGLQITLRSILELIGSIAGEDRFTVRQAAVYYNPLGPAVALQRLMQEPLGGCQITFLAEPELDRVAVAVAGPVAILSLPTYVDLDFINVPLAGH
jgi:hypothetical protein